jgi:hypothetical protein
MEQNMGSEVRGAGEEVLLRPNYRPPGTVIHDAILAGNKSTYRSTGLLAPYGLWEEETCRWSRSNGGESGEEKSLIPCMTAIAIKYLQLGGFYKSGKRTAAKKNAD